MRRIKQIKNKGIVLSWIIPFVLVELLLLFNLIFKINKDNSKDFIISMLLVALIFIPAIIISIKNRNRVEYPTKRRKVLVYLVQLIFISCCFVGLVEASFDSALTTKQVKNFIRFVTGNTEKVIYMDSFTIEIENPKDEYEIGDVIKYNVKYTPSNATIKSPVFTVDNEIVQIDTYKEEIKCLKNGTVNIHFYDSHDQNLCYDIKIVINSVIVNNIEIPEDQKDIFLELDETYQLASPIILPSELKDTKVTYTSSNASVAVVDETGNITALKEGTTTIKCSIDDISDEVYVTVKPITSMKVNKNKISLYPTYANRGTLYFTTNNQHNFKKANVSFEYDCDLDLEINFGASYPARSYFTCYIANYSEDITEDVSFELKVHYTYPGGYRLTEVIDVTLLTYEDLTLEDLDLSKINKDISMDVYFDSDELITKYLEIPLLYKNTKKRNLDNVKFTSDTLNLDSSNYQKIIINFEEIDKNINEHKVKFYPSKDSEDFIEFNIILNYKQIESSYSGFTMNQLYEVSENKKNEIWSTNFKRDLFEDVAFNNPEFNNSGLVIELSDEDKEYLNFIINEYGNIEELSYKKVNKLNYPKSRTLEFTIYSLYEYSKDPNCPKYTYIIDIIVDYDYIVGKIDGYEYFTTDFEITLKSGESVNAKFELVAELENKTSKTRIVKTSGYNIVSDDDKIAAGTTTKISAYSPGITTLSISPIKYYSQNPIYLYLVVNVSDESGVVPLDDSINISVESYKEECKPNLEKKYVSTKTVLKLSMTYSDNFSFISSDNSILSIDGTTATTIKAGKVTIIAVSKDNSEITYSYKLTVYDYIPSFSIGKGEFNSIEFNNNEYTIHLKTDEKYKFDLSYISDTVKYTFKKNTDSKNFNLDETGSLIISKDGTYSGTIRLGDKENPYRKTVKFTIVASDDGIAQTILYFVRKAVGHFGLFLITGMFAVIALFIFNIFRFKNKYIVLPGILVFGPILAYTTELIQKLTPTRYYSLDDVKLDVNGYIWGVCIIIGIYLIYLLIKLVIKKIPKKEKNI